MKKSRPIAESKEIMLAMEHNLISNKEKHEFILIHLINWKFIE